jgi:hypothetical protein
MNSSFLKISTIFLSTLLASSAFAALICEGADGVCSVVLNPCPKGKRTELIRSFPVERASARSAILEGAELMARENSGFAIAGVTVIEVVVCR